MEQRDQYMQERLVFRTRRGRIVVARHARQNDAALLVDMLERLSDRSRWLRYMTTRALVGEAALAEARRVTGGHHAMIVLADDRGGAEVLAIAEMVRDTRDPGTAEIGLVVRDDEQSNGIGSVLIGRLVQIAPQVGITTLLGDVLAENRVILRLLGRLGLQHTTMLEQGVCQVRISVPAAVVADRLVTRDRALVRRQ
jgi:acetyltransferase